MNEFKPQPPRIASMLLQGILPHNVRDDICGDLEEEFNRYILTEKGVVRAKIWFWGQCLKTCTRYLMTTPRLLSFLAIFMTVLMLAALSMSILFMSSGIDDEYIISQSFWLNGRVHQLFFEPAFWSLASEIFGGDFTLASFIDVRSVLFSMTALCVLRRLDNKFDYHITNYIGLGLCIMLAPYVYGYVIFQVNDLALKQAGPLIAFMLLPIMYMAGPICFGAIKKLNRHTRFQ